MKAEDALHITEEAQAREEAAKRQEVQPALDRVYAIIRRAAEEGRSHTHVQFTEHNTGRDPNSTVVAPHDHQYWIVRLLRADGFVAEYTDLTWKIRISWDQA